LPMSSLRGNESQSNRGCWVVKRRKVKVTVVCWLDAQSQNGWAKKKKLGKKLAVITTRGDVVRETKKLLCIAASDYKRGSQVTGIMFIPQSCILWRKSVTIKEPNR